MPVFAPAKDPLGKGGFDGGGFGFATATAEYQVGYE